MAKFDFIFIFSTLGLLITRLISESIHTTSIAIPSLNPPSPSLSTYDLIYCFFFLLQIVYIILHYGHHSNRFQMFPLFIAAAMEAVAVLIMDGDDHGWTRTTLYVLESILILTAIALFLLFPILSFPKPTGNHKVGTTLLYLIDNERDGHIELTTKDGQQYKPERFGLDHRHLVTQVWYPADAEAVATGSFERSPMYELKDIIGPALSKRFGMPGFLLSHLHSTRSHALINAPMMDVDNSNMEHGFPVMVFSHGNGGSKAQNVSTYEELASNGFVVIAVDHSFDAAAAVFPGNPPMLYDLNLAWMFSWKGVAGMREVRCRQAKMRAGDVSFAINILQHLNQFGSLDLSDDPESEFDWDASATSPIVRTNWAQSVQGNLDLHRIAAVGHSLGGASVIVAAHEDPRIKSVVALDPWMFPVEKEIIQQGLSVPLFIMRGNKFAFPPSWEENNEDIATLCRNTPNRLIQRFESLQQEFDMLNSPEMDDDIDESVLNQLLVEMELLSHHIRYGNTAYEAFVPAFRHHDFHDFKGISPILLGALKASGSTSFNRSREIVNSHTLSFLQKTLCQAPTSLMDASHHFRTQFFPEVVLKFYH